jgi:hypothetical protein
MIEGQTTDQQNKTSIAIAAHAGIQPNPQRPDPGAPGRNH